jgi:hypothetical protein
MTVFKKFIKLVKVDEAKHTVLGIATSEVPDQDGEIADYAASKKAFTSWSQDFISKTSSTGADLSLGNIRLMHGLEIAGKAVRIEFKDEQKQIWLESEPVDDRVWNLVKGGFVTGYSIGGSYAWKRQDGSHMRYGPSLSEVSYVDNPCNKDAAFAVVKLDGSVEMRKFADPKNLSDEAKDALSKTAPGISPEELQKAIADGIEKSPVLNEIRKALVKEPVDVFHHECKICPVEKDAKQKAGKDLHVSDYAYVGSANDTATWKLPIHDAAHVRDALAGFNKAQDIPASEKSTVKTRIIAAAKTHSVEVNAALKACLATLTEVIAKVDTSKEETILAKLKNEFRGSIYKSLYEVGHLAELLESLSWLCLTTAYERVQEGDDSAIPDELHEHVKGLATILMDLVEEETRELLTANGGLGEMFMSKLDAELLKAQKTLTDHIDKMSKEHADHCDKMCKLHKDMMETAQDCLGKMKKAIGDPGVETDDQKKAQEAEELKKAAEAKKAEEAKAEEAKKVAEGNGQAQLSQQIAELVKAQSDNLKVVEELRKANDEQSKKIDELVKAQAKQIEPEKAKQTLIPRDGTDVVRKSARSGDVMSDSGI